MKLTKNNLEKFCIEQNCIRFNPSIAASLAKEFDLDHMKIRIGWMEKEAQR